VSIAKNYQFGALNRKWQSLEPERKKLENFNKGYRLSVDDAKVMQQLIIQKLNWSEKLNKLSLDLPSGVWFNELSLRGKNFVLKGSALSLQKEEVSLINQFMDNLKKDTNFFKDFISLELSSVQRRVIAGYDVIDFILTGALK
jgi:Tfp pilus assembly protein PilN